MSLPSMSTRTKPLPSLGSRVGGGQGFTFPPPILLGQDLSLVARGFTLPAAKPLWDAAMWEDGQTLSQSPATFLVWGTRFGPEDRGWARRKSPSDAAAAVGCAPRSPGRPGELRGGLGGAGEPAREVAGMLRG